MRRHCLEPRDYLKTARKLVRAGRGKPRQSDLRRAISTIYYALFHTLCQTCADSFIGTSGADRSNPAWLQVYRALDHGFAKRQCGIQHVMKKFPKSIEDFGNAFTKAQAKRHMADYDPTYSVALSEVIDDIDTAEGVIRDFLKSGRKDKRAFAAWVLLKKL